MNNTENEHVVTLCDKGCCGNCPEITKTKGLFIFTDDFGGKATLSESQLLDLIDVVAGCDNERYTEAWPRLNWDGNRHIITDPIGNKVALTKDELDLLLQYASNILEKNENTTKLGE